MTNHTKLCAQLAADLRHAALKADDAGHDLREFAFLRWTIETVFPQAVNRWIEEACR